MANIAPPVTISPYGYVKAIGDSDYNFGLNDFTIEFWLRQGNINGNTQTLFEVTNNEPQFYNTTPQVRFTAFANGTTQSNNLTVLCANTIYAGIYNANVSFSLPANSEDLVVWYDGILLQNSEWSITANILTITDPLPGNVLVEPGIIISEIIGPQIIPGNNYYTSVERYNGNLYLYVDGIEYGKANANLYIPANTSITSALLTIGGNRDGWNPFFGYFGDFRVTNGVARHVLESRPQGNIYSEFTDSNLGFQAQDINITGGQFNDSVSTFGPEELFPGQVFDTLNFQVYQDTANVPTLGWRIFKSTVTEGPTPSFTAIGDGSTTTFNTPWSKTINSDSVAVLVNGNSQSGANFVFAASAITFIAAPPANANISVQLTGTTEYYSLGNTGITELSSPLYYNDSNIYLQDGSGFLTPTLLPYQLGVIFINGERIRYRYKNGNVLSGLNRGTIGTGVPVSYPTGTRVVSACNDRKLPGNPGFQTWYTLGINEPSNGQGLANSNTVIASFLLQQGTILPD